jgi:hypothetical protein
MNRTFVGTALLAVLSMAALAQAGAATPATTTPSTSTAAPTGAKVGIIEIQQVLAATNEGQRDLESL